MAIEPSVEGDGEGTGVHINMIGRNDFDKKPFKSKKEAIVMYNSGFRQLYIRFDRKYQTKRVRISIELSRMYQSRWNFIVRPELSFHICTWRMGFI